ncbi:MAG: YitT family protein [Clostridia bacterium]|nr:YitT family protein [Clostridia bacterium]
MKKQLKHIFSYIIISALALLLAINYYVFIIENDFAPAGLNGIATMIQYKTGFSISYMSLIINIPLCILAFFLISRSYAVKSLVFTLVYSFFYLLLQRLELKGLQYDAGGHDTIFPVIISGVLSGIVAGICLKNNSASGGMEIVSKYIGKVRPAANFFIVSFIMNFTIAVISLFVYSKNGTLDYKPIALCITYCFVTYYVGDLIIKGSKTAYKFTVITTHSDEIISDITHLLKRGATKIAAKGAFTDTQKDVLICVVDKHQIVEFKDIIGKYDNTFSFYETANETYGNFKHLIHK